MKKRTILLAFIISAVAVTSGCSANEPKTDEVKQGTDKNRKRKLGSNDKTAYQKSN